MKTVSIIFPRNGSPRVEADGFTGVGCKEATAVAIQALGQQTAETIKPEMYQQDTGVERLQEGGDGGG